MQNSKSEPQRLNTLILATGNKHKVQEIQAHLVEVQIVPITTIAPDFHPREDGETFAANAYIKASEALNRTGQAVLADDSGLMVDVLGGDPGVHSAYYAGPHGSDEDNNRKLLEALRAQPESAKPFKGHYVCHMTLLTPEGMQIDVEERVDGHIVLEPRGQGGFGYDPHFCVDAAGRTMAEMALVEKNRISHRARAINALLIQLRRHGLVR